ncbi:MAG: PKD domain-containing protein [Anaerolineae bacterium]|nr:PKD domain-containing protein [Anaerolineae bacterium]
MAIFPMINSFVFQSLHLVLGLVLWQASPGESPVWIRVAFLVALGLTALMFWIYFRPDFHLGQTLGTVLIIVGGLVTTALFLVLLFRINPFPFIRANAETMGLGQLVNFDTAFANGLPDAVSANIGVVNVVRADTDADDFQEWVVFYLFDKRAQNSPIHGAVYDNDRGNPPVIFPYQLQAPDRNYLSEQQVFGPNLTVQEVAADQNGPNGANVPEIIVQGGYELTIFRFKENSDPWSFPTDSPARYQPIGFFRGNGGVSINLNQGAAAYGQVTVIDRNGFERSQLAVRSVYGLVTGPDGNQTYLDPIPPLGGVGTPRLAAPILSTVDFHPAPPDEIFNTPFPEKIVLGFYAATCGAADNSLCNSDTVDPDLSWRPPTGSLNDFLAGEALAAFDAGNPGYFSLPAFSANSNILVSQLRYYPQLETDPDLLATGGGRDVVTGEQGQSGCVGINFTVNGSASQEAYYQLGLSAGQWKILRRVPNCVQIPPQFCTFRLEAQPAPQTVQVPVIFLVTVYDETGASIPAGAITWEFGDGNPSISGSGSGAAAAQHAYDAAGNFNVIVRGTDNRGILCAPASSQVSVVPPTPTPVPLVPIITAPATASVCEEVPFSGAESQTQGQISAYEWNFGDSSTGNGMDLTHTYTDPSVYTVTLVVRDLTGRPSPPASHVITITPPPAPPCGPLPCCK